MKKLTYLIFTCVLALTCIFWAGCKVTFLSSTLTPTESHDFKNTFYPKGVSVDFRNLEQLTEAVQNGNQDGGYFLTLDLSCKINHGCIPIEGESVIKYNVNTNSEIENGNSITQRGYYHDGVNPEEKIEEGDIHGEFVYTFQYVYICYETKNKPQSLSFEHSSYDAGIEEEDIYDSYYKVPTEFDKIIVVSDQEENVVSRFAYRVNPVCESVITSDYMENLITQKAITTKGGIKPHPDDVDKTYISSKKYELTRTHSIYSINYSKYNRLIEEVQKEVDQNNSCFAVMNVEEDDKFIYSNMGDFRFEENEKNKKLLVFGRLMGSAFFVEESEIISKRYSEIMFFYLSYELETEPTKLRFKHYFNEYGNYQRLILVYDQNNNLVLEFSYKHNLDVSNLSLYVGGHFGDKKIEEFITQNLIFVKGE